MPLQIQVSKGSVIDAGDRYEGKLFNIILNLKCWAEGANIETDPAVIDQDFTGQYKEVEELTITQQVTKAAVDIEQQMQAVIDRYNQEQAILNNSLLDSAVTGIQTALEG